MARSQNSFGHVKNYGSSDGLPSPETYFVKEDLKGYLWVGTDRGLSRYDGYTFKNFTSGNSALTNNTIFNVYESPAGNLWFACYDGSITIYDPVKELFTPFKGNDSLKKWFKYWPAHVAFNEDTAVIFEYNVFNECAVFVNQTIKRQAYTSFDSITSIYFEDINAYRTLFDAFYASKRHLFANKVGRINTIADSSLRLRFEYVVSRKGSSFFYYDYNLYELRNGHVSVYERFDHPIQHIGLDQYGRLMASTEGGAYVETNTGFSEVLKGRMISDVSQDIEGNYWVASLDNGIYKIPDIGAVHHMKLDYPVNSLLGDGTHLFMGGADQILVYEASSRKIKTVRDKVSRSPKTLRINEFDKNRGKVLTGAHHLLTHDKDVGLQRFFDDSRFKRSIYLGHGQILAAGAYNGLYFLNELDSTIVYNADFDQVITGFDEDETDTVWIGTLNSGMWYTLRDKLLKPKQLKHPDGPKDRITEVLHTSDNTRIFGTISSGVFLLRNGQMKQLSVEDGLISEVVNALTLESDSVLWVGTNKGLNKLHLEDNLENCRVLYSLNADDGLPYSYIYCLEFWRNKLYLGVERGVLEIIPDRLKPLPVKPRMDIGQIQIAQTSGHPAGDMVFKHFQNDISIDYVGISFNKPESDFYRYRLLYSGDDDTSYRYTSNTSIDFLNLAPGSYQFEVACRDKNNNWSKTKTYSFEITPHYTDTIWFKVSVVAFVIIFLL
ncbi:MAG: hypothetical protein JJ975_13260, partial [Bacteroidia bacterium]|nr:hypothetical protein [Bacteroidia bacterium]